MCRSIKVLRRPPPVATREEITAAALQFVRKVSGYHKPSKANQAAFDAAVAEIADTTERLLDQVTGVARTAVLLLAVCGLAFSQPADTVFYNGKIVTLAKDRPVVEAVAIRDHRFTAVG